MKRQVLIDLETTALTPKRGEILRLYARDLNDPSSTYNLLMKPKRPLSKLVQQITGISNEMVRQAPTLEAVMRDFPNCSMLVSVPLPFDITHLFESKQVDNSDDCC